MKTITCICIALLNGVPVVAATEFVDDFRTAELQGRLAERGEWQFRDGIARCTGDPHLYRQFKNH